MEERRQELLDAELKLWEGQVSISMDILAMGGTPEQAMEAALSGGDDLLWN